MDKARKCHQLSSHVPPHKNQKRLSSATHPSPSFSPADGGRERGVSSGILLSDGFRKSSATSSCIRNYSQAPLKIFPKISSKKKEFPNFGRIKAHQYFNLREGEI